jgi:hypothetical protein
MRFPRQTALSFAPPAGNDTMLVVPSKEEMQVIGTM